MWVNERLNWHFCAFHCVTEELQENKMVNLNLAERDALSEASGTCLHCVLLKQRNRLHSKKEGATCVSITGVLSYV